MLSGSVLKPQMAEGRNNTEHSAMDSGCEERLQHKNIPPAQAAATVRQQQCGSNNTGQLNLAAMPVSQIGRSNADYCLRSGIGGVELVQVHTHAAHRGM